MAQFTLGSVKEYADFGKAFLEFYLENGFGNKSKTDIDTKILSLIIKLDNSFELKKLALQLGITPQRFNNLCLQADFRYGQYSEDNQKKKLLELLNKTHYGYGKEGELRFLLNNPVLRVLFEAYCMEHQILYNTSFNKDIVTMSYQDFSNFLTKVFKDDIDAQKLKKENQTKGITGSIIETLPTAVQSISGLVDLKDFSGKTAEYLTNMWLSFKK